MNAVRAQVCLYFIYLAIVAFVASYGEIGLWMWTGTFDTTVSVAAHHSMHLGVEWGPLPYAEKCPICCSKHCTEVHDLTCASFGFVLDETGAAVLGEQRARSVIQSGLTMVQVVSRLGCWAAQCYTVSLQPS
jgi:hypothetical protein